MKNWTKPEINSISIENTEVFTTLEKISRPDPSTALDVVVVKSEGSSDIEIQS